MSTTIISSIHGHNNPTKQQLAERLYPKINFDVAVPQSWVTSMRDNGIDDAARHFVTLYPENGTPYIAPITDRGIEIVARLCS